MKKYILPLLLVSGCVSEYDLSTNNDSSDTAIGSDSYEDLTPPSQFQDLGDLLISCVPSLQVSPSFEQRFCPKNYETQGVDEDCKEDIVPKGIELNEDIEEILRDNVTLGDLIQGSVPVTVIYTYYEGSNLNPYHKTVLLSFFVGYDYNGSSQKDRDFRERMDEKFTQGEYYSWEDISFIRCMGNYTPEDQDDLLGSPVERLEQVFGIIKPDFNDRMLISSTIDASPTDWRFDYLVTEGNQAYSHTDYLSYDNIYDISAPEISMRSNVKELIELGELLTTHFEKRIGIVVYEAEN